MRYISPAAIISAALMTGCAQTYYAKPGATDAQARQDQLECSLRAKEATAAIRSGIEAGWQQADIERTCMSVRGYTLYRKP